jgi:hypothetical protein
MTRLGRAVALTAFVACALATPLGGRALGRACAAGAVHVAVVVDSGTGSTVSAVCVPGDSFDNGAAILAARASMLGVPQPRYSASGLLCAIDGVPATGCGDAHGGHYAYWSYWHGQGGNWSYNNFGPASWRVDASVVEGWRYQPDGAGLPTDPPPRGPATAASVCVPAPPPTTAPRTTVAPTPRTTVPSGPASTVGAQQVPTTAATSGTGSAVPTSAPAPPTDGSTATNATTATTVRRAVARAPGEPTSTSSSSSVALSARGIAAAGPTHSSGGAPVGLIVGVPLVIALGAGGAIAARRRSRPAS